MPTVYVDPVSEKQGVLARAVAELDRRKSEFFAWCEDFELKYDRLGVWIGVRSLRPHQLLQSLRRSIFVGFEPHWLQEEDGRVWARFGYL